MTVKAERPPGRPYGCSCPDTGWPGNGWPGSGLAPSLAACRKAAWPLDPHPIVEDITAYIPLERLDELRKDPTP